MALPANKNQNITNGHLSDNSRINSRTYTIYRDTLDEFTTFSTARPSASPFWPIMMKLSRNFKLEITELPHDMINLRLSSDRLQTNSNIN